MTNLPTNKIEECIGQILGTIQSPAIEQLKALVAENERLEKENKEFAKCIADSTFGGWYS